jgi:hypothetical protein
MDASRYFFQQLSGRFFRIVLLSSFLFIAIIALLVIRENQLNLIADQELPSLTKKHLRQQQILSTYLTLDALTKRTNAENLSEDYQQAQQQINDISTGEGNNKSKLSLMFVGHKEYAGIIDKLSTKHDRNEQLKQSSIIQFQLINDQLTIDIKDKLQRKQLLFQQIQSDKFSDKVTATRAKAYAKQVNELANLQQLQQTIIRGLLAFQQLDLQYSIIEFDDVSAELRLALNQSLPKDGSKDKDVALLIKQLITLEQLLFSQQNSVAKWRSYLRLTRSYVEFIKQQQNKLQQLVLESVLNQQTFLKRDFSLLSMLPTEIKTFFNEQKVALSNQHLQLSVLIFIASLFLLLLIMIFNIKNKIKSYSLESILKFSQFIENMTQNGEEKLTPVQLNSAENKQIAEEIEKMFNTLVKPQHSEKEYQQKLEEQETAAIQLDQKTEEILQLQSHLSQLESVNTEQGLKRDYQEGIQNEQLTNMVVRTMLQSQSVSLGAGVSSFQVYRQLVRIYDWCKQSKTRSEFAAAVQPMALCDVALHHEIDTALINIIADTHFQRNKIYYQQDEQLLTQAKLDVELFHQLFNGICRLLLTDIFKASLHINCSVVDKNQGQQFVRFDFSVATGKKIAQLPEDIARLSLVECIDSEHATSNDSVDYLRLLLSLLNVTDKNVQLQESGYLFSFTLPIASADVTQRIDSNNVDLKQANFFLLSDDENICLAVQKTISTANGYVDIFAKPKLIIEQLSTENLTAKRIEMVVVGSDFYPKSLEMIQLHIETLTEKIQPKLFVMQPYFNTSIHRYGLFEQTANPLKISALQQSVSSLLASTKSSNIQFDANYFAGHQYLATQVEVLFAVENPTKHLILLRVLQWLGLQVKVVSQPKALLKLWSTGRYLLLFTEFEQSPFIQLAAGKDVRRDIFTFKKRSFAIEDNSKLTDKWQVSLVPELDNIDNLVALLQPWLKAKPTSMASLEQSSESSNDNQKCENIIVDTLQTVEQLDEVFSTLTLVAPSTNMEKQEEPFNLEKYAQNQGSTELAIVMLDDYITDIEQVMEQLSTALEEQNYLKGVSLIQSLIKTSTILAAEDFINLCQQLLAALKQPEVIEVQKAKQLFEELVHQQRLLNQFAEAI